MENDSTNQQPAKEETLAGSPALPCSDFWGCVAASVHSIASALPRVPHSEGYARIELATQLKRLVDIIERASFPVMKIDGQNSELCQPSSANNRAK
jgi:hypothetical protein